MDNALQFANGLQWLGGGVVVLLGAVGAGSLILAILNRFWGNRDKAGAIHESNQANRIQADLTLVQELLRRVKDLEVSQKETQEKLMALTTDNAELKIRNEYLGKELDRKEKQIEELHKENISRQGRITHLETEVTRLQSQLDELLDLYRIDTLNREK